MGSHYESVVRFETQVQRPKGASWGLIVFFLFVFFPVGIALMVSKVHKEKHNYVSNGNGITRVGWVVVGLGVLYIFSGLTGSLETENGDSVVGAVIMFSSICFCGGYALVRYGEKYKKLGEKYLRYSSIVANRTDRSLDNIAAAFPVTYEEVCKDLQQMIDAGFFPNCYIDFSGRNLIAPFDKVSSGGERVANEPKLNAPAKPKSIKCLNCGGINAAGITECEYCGLPL